MKNHKLAIYRYYGRFNETIFEKINRPVGLKYLIIYYKLHNTKNSLIKIYYKCRLKKLQKKTFIQIPSNVKIGKGLYIGHGGPIIINPNVTIGNNCNISNGVTIGQENRGKRKGVPKIGSDVWIGTNSVVVGNITIGNDVMIAPLSFVNFDVPSHSVVIGNPAKIINKDNATQDYINRKV